LSGALPSAHDKLMCIDSKMYNVTGKGREPSIISVSVERETVNVNSCHVQLTNDKHELTIVCPNMKSQ